jgi:hypothetical protein
MALITILDDEGDLGGGVDAQPDVAPRSDDLFVDRGHQRNLGPAHHRCESMYFRIREYAMRSEETVANGVVR